MIAIINNSASKVVKIVIFKNMMYYNFIAIVFQFEESKSSPGLNNA